MTFPIGSIPGIGAALGVRVPEVLVEVAQQARQDVGVGCSGHR